MSNTNIALYAIVNGGQVIDVVGGPLGPPAEGETAIELNYPRLPWVTTDWVYADNNTVMPPSLDHLKQQMLAHAAAKRWAYQNEGFVYEDNTYHTDAGSLGLMQGKVADYDMLVAAHGPDKVLTVSTWKAQNGFVQVDIETIRVVAQMIVKKVQQLFDSEARIARVVAVETTVDAAITTYDLEISKRWTAYGTSDDPVNHYPPLVGLDPEIAKGPLLDPEMPDDGDEESPPTQVPPGPGTTEPTTPTSEQS